MNIERRDAQLVYISDEAWAEICKKNGWEE